ncbi:MAG: hypothetical protein KDD61_06185 [Bdellovibrionales bacterium]|nr:hypothetical protein [Bdellovibrionales bacterium]
MSPLKKTIVVICSITHLACFAKSDLPLTLKEQRFLTTVGEFAARDTIQRIQEIQWFIECLKSLSSCQTDMKKEINTYIQVIQEVNRQYRTLIMVDQWQTIRQGRRYVNLSGLPIIKVARGPASSSIKNEYSQAMTIVDRDRKTMEMRWKEKIDREKLVNESDFHFELLKERFLNQETHWAQTHYKNRIKAIAERYPFVMYLNSERPTQNDILKAFEIYLKKLDAAFMYITEDLNAVHEYFALSNSIEDVLEQHPEYSETYASIQAKLQEDTGIVAWIEKNLSTVIALGFGACAFASNLAGPSGRLFLGLPCGSAAVSLNVKGFAEALLEKKETESYWISGLVPYKELKEANSKIAYNMIMLAVNGSGLLSTLKSTKRIRKFPIATALKVGYRRISLNAVNASQLLNGAKQTAIGKMKQMGKDGVASSSSHSIVISEDEVQVTRVSIPQQLIGYLKEEQLLLVTSKFLTYSDLVALKNVATHVAMK